MASAPLIVRRLPLAAGLVNVAVPCQGVRWLALRSAPAGAGVTIRVNSQTAEPAAFAPGIGLGFPDPLEVLYVSANAVPGDLVLWMSPAAAVSLLALDFPAAGVAVVDAAAEAVLGTDADVAVDSDANGTISGKLRGLVKILASAWDGAVALIFKHRGPAGVPFAVQHNPAPAAQATITQPADGAGGHNVCTALAFGVTTGAAAPAAAQPLTFNLRDGATGVGPVLMSFTLQVPAAADWNRGPVVLSGLWIEGTASTAMTLETAGIPLANSQAYVNLIGTTVP